ncbi:MAG: hypothetical protein ACOC4G_09355 [Bacillota bacterium]
MGVRFNRNYEDIIEELMMALINIENVYEFFDMKTVTWNNLEEKTQKEFLRTMSNDLIYGLDKNSEFNIGQGLIKYNKQENIIQVISKDDTVTEINLV